MTTQVTRFEATWRGRVEQRAERLQFEVEELECRGLERRRCVVAAGLLMALSALMPGPAWREAR